MRSGAISGRTSVWNDGGAAALHRHAVAVAGKAVAGRAEDLVAPLAAGQNFAGHQRFGSIAEGDGLGYRVGRLGGGGRRGEACQPEDERKASHAGTSRTVSGSSSLRKLRVAASSKRGSSARTHMKKRSALARSKPGTANSG